MLVQFDLDKQNGKISFGAVQARGTSKDGPLSVVLHYKYSIDNGGGKKHTVLVTVTELVNVGGTVTRSGSADIGGSKGQISGGMGQGHSITYSGGKTLGPYEASAKFVAVCGGGS